MSRSTEGGSTTGAWAPVTQTLESFTVNVAATGGIDNADASGLPVRVRPTPACKDVSAYPAFASLQAALDDIADVLWHDVIVQLAAATFDGALVCGFLGGGSKETGEEVALVIKGTLSAPAIAGITGGAASVGTNATTIASPVAGTWVANALVGYYAVITAGGGSSGDASRPTIRPIKSNTANDITIDSVPGLAFGSTFAIVDPGTTLQIPTDDDVILRVSNNQPTVVFHGLKFDVAGAARVVSAARTSKVVFEGCTFDATTTEVELLFETCQSVELVGCIFSGGTGLHTKNCVKVSATAIRCDGSGTLKFDDTVRGDLQVTSVDAVGVLVDIEGAQNFAAEVLANDGGDSAVRLDSVLNFVAQGTDLLSGTGNAGYGIEISKAGHYDLVGSTITGVTGDLYFMNQAITWANLSSDTYGAAAENAGNAVARAGYAKTLTYGNRTYTGNVDISGRLLLFGYMNISANTVIPTIVGVDVLDMEAGTINGVIPVPPFGQIRGVLEVDCDSATAIVRLPSNAAIAGVISGVINVGSAAVIVEPPVGGLIDGGASVNVPAGTSKLFVSANGNGGKNYYSLS